MWAIIYNVKFDRKDSDAEQWARPVSDSEVPCSVILLSYIHIVTNTINN